jgi:hypothetical protein
MGWWRTPKEMSSTLATGVPSTSFRFSTPVTIATAGETHYGIALDTLGDIFYTDNLGGAFWEVPLAQPTNFEQLVQGFDNLTVQYMAPLFASIAASNANQTKALSVLGTEFQGLSSSYAALSSPL